MRSGSKVKDNHEALKATTYQNNSCLYIVWPLLTCYIVGLFVLSSISDAFSVVGVTGTSAYGES